jgi:hypothetical protein
MSVSKTAQDALELLRATDSQGALVSHEVRLRNFLAMLQSGKLLSLEKLLPVILNRNGKPYTLDNHFPFASMFQLHIPSYTVLKTGRQLGKSTLLATHGIVQCNTIPYFQTLYLTPQYEQIRRFSANYVKKFIQESPVRALFSDTTTTNSVLQRSFRNFSGMLFSFALLDVDRVRGISADRVSIDEIQDFNRDFLPVVEETMSAKPNPIMTFTGTPKTLENTIEGLWSNSSQAEWIMKCRMPGCNEWNFPSLEFHAEKMIGPLRDDISEDAPGIVCHKCQKPIFPRDGCWLHRRPENQWKYAGYHIPQFILPLHYAYKNKWATILAKKDGLNNYTPGKFWNEVMGESYDTSTKLVSLTELRRACTGIGPNTDERAQELYGQFPFRVLAVDWGGGGAEGVSFTTLALLCWDGNKIRCVWGKRLYTPHDHMREAHEILHYIKMFQPSIMAHDYTGAGAIRESVMVQAGFPLQKMMPVQYCRSASRAPCHFVAASAMHPRDHYMVDKTRSLLMTCNSLKLGHLELFDYDYINSEQRGLVQDFLSLVEEKTDSKRGSDIYMIYRNPQLTDDFAQAVNIGCVAIWHAHQNYPDLSGMSGIQLTQQQARELTPISPWEEEDF